MRTLKYYRIFNDSMGESHIDEVEVKQSNISSPIPPLKMSQNFPAARYSFVTFPPKCDMGWHVAPAKQFAVMVSGIFEAESSDGNKVQLGPGSVCIMEDFTGKGHNAKNVGDGEAECLFIQVP
jgi:quercetin dioxygenase-like cupin family protein